MAPSGLVFWDGSKVPIACLQSDAATRGNFLYEGTAPISVTCKLPDQEWLESKASIDPWTGRPSDADASMLLRRLKIYRFTKRMPRPVTQFASCAGCFSDLVLRQARAAGL